MQSLNHHPPDDLSEPVIDAEALACQIDLLFGRCGGYIPLRAFPEKGGTQGKPHLTWIVCDTAAPAAAVVFCETASAMGLAAYVIPGTVAERGKAGATDICQMQALLIDLDDGDIEAKAQLLKKAVGAPSLVVKSGGITPEGQAKLHLYWKLSAPVEGEELQKLLDLRRIIAEAAGGDLHFASAHQPIRLAGSIYRKHGVAKPVFIRERNAVEYRLDELTARMEALAPEREFLKHNGHRTSIGTILTTRVRENGADDWTRFDGISRVIGHWLRRCHEGNIARERAEEEIRAYNAACLVPPWPPERVQQEIDRLWKKHCAEHGEPSSPPAVEYFTARQTLAEPPAIPFDIIGPRVLTPGGLWLLAGPPKVGKSDFLLSLFSHAAAGLDFLRFTINRPLRIFYAQAELEQAYLRERYLRIVGGNRDAFAPGLDNLVMTSRFHFPLDEAGVNAIAEAVNGAFGGTVDIIALDPFRNLFQAGLSGGDVNAELMAFFRQRMEKLLAKTNPQAGLILVHHTNKIPGKLLAEDPMAAISGGGAMLSYPSALMVMNRAEHEEQSGVTCWFDLRYGPGIPTTTFIRDGDGWKEIGQHDMRLVRQRWGEMNDKEQARKRVAILDFIFVEAKEGRLYTVESLSAALASRQGLGSHSTVRNLINLYQSKGFIRFIDNDTAVCHGVQRARSPLGYLCVEGMRREAAGGAPEQLYLPTHYRCPQSDQVFTLNAEDIHRWHYAGEDA